MPNCRSSRSSTIYSVSKVATYDLFNPQQVVLPGVPTGTRAEANASTVVGRGRVRAGFDFAHRALEGARGLRFDYLNQIRHDYVVERQPRSHRSRVARASAIYEPLDWLTLYGSFSQSFSPLADTLISSGAFSNGARAAEDHRV